MAYTLTGVRGNDDDDDDMFISFDICDFYPSITNKLLEKSLTVASQSSSISVDDICIIKHTKNLHSLKTAPHGQRNHLTSM